MAEQIFQEGQSFKVVDVQESMAREFFTSPSNTRSKVPIELAADIPVAGDKMSTLVQFDWTRANARSTEITERWNREMK